MKKCLKKIITGILTLAIVITTVLVGVSTTASAAAIWRKAYDSKGMVTVASGQSFEAKITLKTHSKIAWFTTMRGLFGYTITIYDSKGKPVEEARKILDADVNWLLVNKNGEQLYQHVDYFYNYVAGTYTIRIEIDSQNDVPAMFSAKTLDTSANMPVLKDQDLTAGFKTTLKVKNETIKKCESSNKSVATVTSKGVVTGKKKGIATIKVTTAKGATLSCKINVKANTYSAAKITKADVMVGSYDVKPYSAKYDSKGNLVVKAMAINNGPRKVKVKVWPDSFKDLSRKDKMASLTLPANSAKSVTLKFKKSTLQKQKNNFPVNGFKLFNVMQF